MSLTAIEPSSASADGAKTESVALRVLNELEQAEIAYCVLRGGDPLHSTDDEIDLLVPPHQIRTLRRVLGELGFVRIRAWGHAPHHFFVTYDAGEDRWLKLDVVTQIAYGRPTHSLATRLAENCLRNRERSESVWVPGAEDELVTLLLHCVVDKGDFPAVWQQRISRLCEQIRDEAYLSELLAKYWSAPMTGRTLQNTVEKEQWNRLLENGPAVKRRLAGTRRIGTVVRSIRDHLLRKLNRLARLLRPQSLSVALLAPDGAGKSTLAEGICSHFFFPVEQIYMGLYQQGSGKAARSRVPGFGLLRKLCSQWHRYVRAHVHRARGRFVIFDRYTYDALLPAPYELTRLQRLRRWLLAHACPAPDLILLLDAPGEMLFARSGEHQVEYLEQHRQAYVKMLRQFPQMVVVDATRDTGQVRRKAIAHIWRRFSERFGEHHQQQVSPPH
ncbi:MAG: hypothetical protein ACC628_00555 [Pirellulaceae bacterium]